MAYVRADLAEPGTELEIDVRGKRRAARVASKPLYTRKELSLGRGHLPRRPALPRPSTTGPGSRASTPSSGSPGTPRTRSARSSSTTRPRSARRSHKDASYAEVESVKAVSDVIAPLSGEIIEVNEALGDTPEQINEDPYGEGWLVKVKLTAPAGGRGAARRRRLPQAAGKLAAEPRHPLP